MSRRDCSGGQYSFFKTHPPDMQAKPQSTPIGHDAMRGKFRRQAAGGQRPRRDLRTRPVRTLTAQGARLVADHLAGRQRPRVALMLASLQMESSERVNMLEKNNIEQVRDPM
jgi:hypothetical protein